MAKARNRTNDPIGLRNRLLDAAAVAFQSNGYGSTSIHDLTRATGVSGGALHHHFPSKKSIALAVIDERVAAEVATTWIDRVQGAPTAAQGIIAVFDAVAAALEAQGSVGGCPLGNLATELSGVDRDLRSALARGYADWREAIAAKIAEDQRLGRAGYASSDPSGFADVVIALFTGALTVGKAEQSTAALRSAERQLRSLMDSDV